MGINSATCYNLNWADQTHLKTNGRYLHFGCILCSVSFLVPDFRSVLSICTPLPSKPSSYVHKVTFEWQTKARIRLCKPPVGMCGFNRDKHVILPCIKACWHCELQWKKKKTKHMFKMLRAGGAGTEQIRKQIWRQKRSTNLKKNAPLLTKEISSVKSISFKHVLLSANRRLTWGVPSDRSGCGTRHVRLDPSLVDFVTYKSKERENWNMKGRKSRAASSNNL